MIVHVYLVTMLMCISHSMCVIILMTVVNIFRREKYTKSYNIIIKSNKYVLVISISYNMTMR